MISIKDIHVGDRVKIRERNNMIAEYGGDADGTIFTPGWIWVLAMDRYCGKEAVVCRISDNNCENLYGKSIEIWFEDNVCGFAHYTIGMIELVDTTPPYEITDEEFFKILDAREE